MAAEPPDNSALVRALAAVLEAPSGELEVHLKPLLHTLLGSTLLSGDGRHPTTVETDDEEEYLALFTDPVELHFFEPGTTWRLLAASKAIEQVARGDFDGLVINPGPRQLELSREDIQDFFEIDAP